MSLLAEQRFRSTTRTVFATATILTMASLGFAGAIQYQAARESNLREAIESYHLRTLPLLERIASGLASLSRQLQEPRAEAAPGSPIESHRGLLIDVREAIESVAGIQSSVGLEDFAPAVARLEDRFARMERFIRALPNGPKATGSASAPSSSVILATEQLRLLHSIALKRSLAASHSGRISGFRRTALATGALATICTLLFLRIFVLMRRQLRHAKRVEAELERSRDRLLHSQKIEALGRLTAGVAHDFNNLLTSILGRAELLKEGLPSGAPLAEHATEIMESAERASALTRQLLQFSRQQVGKPDQVDVNALIGELLNMLDDLLGEKVSLALGLQPELEPVRVDPRQLEQVIVNLTLNARDAMPFGGVIEIQTDNVAIGPDSKAHVPGVQEGRYARIRVSDEGCGVDPDILHSIFDPFFTTKPEGEGTGLGLSTVKGLVTSWGGDVFVESEPGRGSCFEILLPVHEAAEVEKAPAEPSRLPSGSETILVAEDLDAVRRLACHFLSQAGYSVVDAANGAEALRLCFSSERRVDLMLVDVLMPTMSGPELVERVRQRRPQMRVLYMSGYADDESFRERVRNEEDALVEKPFRRATLLEAVRSKLDEPSAGPETPIA